MQQGKASSSSLHYPGTHSIHHSRVYLDTPSRSLRPQRLGSNLSSDTSSERIMETRRAGFPHRPTSRSKSYRMAEMIDEVMWMFSTLLLRPAGCLTMIASAPFFPLPCTLSSWGSKYHYQFCSAVTDNTYRYGKEGDWRYRGGNMYVLYVLKKRATWSASNPRVTLMERTQSIRKPNLIVKICTFRGIEVQVQVHLSLGGRG